MPDVLCVVGLGHDVAAVVERSVALLNEGQDRFVFSGSQGPDLPPQDLDGAYSWDLLDLFLRREKERIAAHYLFGIVAEPIEHNYFSHAQRKEGFCCITTSDWDYLCRLPVHSYVAYSIVRNLVGMLIGKSHRHEDTRGCIYDFCRRKSDYSFKIRTADICPECLDFLKALLEPETLETIVALLEKVRLAALGRDKAPRPSDAHSLPDVVDRDFPFPIAYCFRSMQTEIGYSRKWLKLLELYEVTLKYITFVLISDLPGDRSTFTAIPDLAGISRPSVGHWHSICFALLNAARSRGVPSFASRACESLAPRLLRDARLASERLVSQRNETRGHGLIEEEARYRRYYEDALPLVKTLLEFASPFARYRLLKVGEGLQHRRGTWTFTAKVLKGSHPLFPVEEHTTASPVDTDCCLLHDDESGSYLSLYPWILLDTCELCFREMVFLYDKVDERGACMREYPTNHTKWRSDLAQTIQSFVHAG
jgi:hypothetical protein